MIFKVQKYQDKEKIFDFNINDPYSSTYICNYALDTHFPTWDTAAREDSNICERIEEFDSYILTYINIADIGMHGCSVDTDDIEEYAELPTQSMPPLVLTTINGDRYSIIDGCHRYEACKINGVDKVLAFIPVQD